MQHVWIDRLTAPFLVRAVAGLGLRRGVIFHRSSTPGALALLRLLRSARLARLEARPIIATMSARDGAGQSIRAAAFARVNRCALAAAGRAGWLPEGQRHAKAAWVRVFAAHFQHKAAEAVNRLCFAENAYAVGTVSAQGVRRITLFVSSGCDASAIIRQDWSFPVGSRLREWRTAGIWREAVRDLAAVALLPLLPLLSLRWSKPRRRLDGAAVAEGTVLVQYEPGLLRHYPSGATVDWLAASGVSPARLVCYFNRPDAPASPENVARVDSLGFGWIDAAALNRHAAWRPRLVAGLMGEALGSLVPAVAAGEFWQWVQFVRNRVRLEAHRALIRSVNAKAIVQHFEFDAGTVAQSLAAREEDAAFLWTPDSVYVFLNPIYQCASVDAIVGQGPHNIGGLKLAGMEYQAVFDVGYVGSDGTADGDAARAAELRAGLDPRCAFVIAVFDSSHSATIHHSTDSVLAFYRAVLAALEATPGWGAIVKPKGDSLRTLLGRDGIGTAVEALVRERRLIVLETERPSVCALAADVALCYAANSAGFTASVLTGRPVVHADLPALHFHPAYAVEGWERILFPTMDRALAAVSAVAAGDPTVGRCPAFDRLLDRYRDGRGRERFGRIMRTYLDARTRGLACRAALARAVADHAAGWGEGTADIDLDGDCYEADRLWAEVRRRHYPGWAGGFPPFRSAGGPREC